MPYNTRRKSLSLPSLGIQLPNGSRSHRSPSAPKVPSTAEIQPPPSKKVKRSHHSESPSPVSASSGAATSAVKVDSNQLKGRRGTGPFEHTPPPSPADVTAGISKVDTEGINDDIVVAVIQQLEKTGNRPHLIKELATVLSSINETVANSVNAAALLSSRLSLYMKRPWTALAPCPIGKELMTTPPRKVFFYLTTCAHQPLPEESDGVLTPTSETKQITPSLSSASVDLDDVDDMLARERSRLSPSPEVDLSAPAFDEDDNEDLIDHSATPTGGFGSRNNLSSMRNHRLSHNHRAVSPPLEGDEREFTQTATSVRERTSSEELASRVRQGLETSDDMNRNGDMASSSSEGATTGTETSRDQSQSENGGYEDYFSVNVQGQDQDHDLDSAAVNALFGTSPSPSASSELSSVSSATSNTSDGEPEMAVKVSEDDVANNEALLTSNGDVTTTIGLGIPSTQMGMSDVKSIAGIKRPISVLESATFELGSPSGSLRVVDSESDTPLAISTTFIDRSYMGLDDNSGLSKSAMELSMSFDACMDPWSDLRSPETIDVDELDEIFADI